MKIKNPMVNAIFVILMSFIYGCIYILTSNHVEFLGSLPGGNTLDSQFWNWWLSFIKDGNMKYMV